MLKFHFSYKNQFEIVPILVGSLSAEREACYGRVLASYLADPQNLFVISSDFCHWGQRFRYTYYDHSHGSIYQSIEGLDRAVRCCYEIDGFYDSHYLCAGYEYHRKSQPHRVHQLFKEVRKHYMWKTPHRNTITGM